MNLHHKATHSGKLLNVLRGEMGLSSTLVGRLKRENALMVNGVSAFTNHPLSPGDEICVVLDEAQPDFPSQALGVEILYEDEGLIALDKPPGVLMHPTASRQNGTLANRLLYYFEQTRQPCGIHPISRLDRDTFGVVLFAKNSHLHARCGGFEKIYHAAVVGCPPDAAGEIQLPIARRENSLWREIHPQGKSALTHYRILEQMGGLSLLCLRPITGRTHQLRLHCMAAGFPILGDSVYTTVQSTAMSQSLGLFTQQLLAKSLAFSHPLTGKAMEIVSKQAVFWG